MCFSNCKNENFHGECTKRIDKYDTSLHCFEGFSCELCEDIHTDTDTMMELEKSERTICNDCQEVLGLAECKQCGYVAEQSEFSQDCICPDCEKYMFAR